MNATQTQAVEIQPFYLIAVSVTAVQQKLMRYADIRTLNIYGDVVTDEMSQAHAKVVHMVLPKKAVKGWWRARSYPIKGDVKKKVFSLLP
jgi:hypothetical protein